MSTPNAIRADRLPALAAARPAQMRATLELSDDAHALLAGDPSASDWLASLLTGNLHEDALRYLAHALPRAAAVRWACDCVRAMRVEAVAPAVEAALAIARQWAATGDKRFVAEAARAADATALRADSALRFVLLAAAWSGASLSPPGLPPSPPDPAIGAAAVAAAVLIAAAQGDPASIAERQRQCIGRGIVLAQGFA